MDLKKLGNVFGICIAITNYHITLHPLRKNDAKFYRLWRKNRYLENLKEFKKHYKGKGKGLQMVQKDNDLTFATSESSISNLDSTDDDGNTSVDSTDRDDKITQEELQRFNSYRSPLAGMESEDEGGETIDRSNKVIDMEMMEINDMPKNNKETKDDDNSMASV